MPEHRELLEQLEAQLCECNRPDELENPHRHKVSVACVYWALAKRDSWPTQAELEKVMVEFGLLHGITKSTSDGGKPSWVDDGDEIKATKPRHPSMKGSGITSQEL